MWKGQESEEKEDDGGGDVGGDVVDVGHEEGECGDAGDGEEIGGEEGEGTGEGSVGGFGGVGRVGGGVAGFGVFGVAGRRIIVQHGMEGPFSLGFVVSVVKVVVVEGGYYSKSYEGLSRGGVFGVLGSGGRGEERVGGEKGEEGPEKGEDEEGCGVEGSGVDIGIVALEETVEGEGKGDDDAAGVEAGFAIGL